MRQIWKLKLVHSFFILSLDVSKQFFDKGKGMSSVSQENLEINPDKSLKFDRKKNFRSANLEKLSEVIICNINRLGIISTLPFFFD